MIEAIMYFGIGFLTASLLGLVIIPLIHNRAVRLTHRRLEAATPLSIAEIQADKDQLRAEFAMSTRRLELSVEQLKARSTGQLSELGRQAEAITLLKSELGEKNAAIMGLETRERMLKEQIGTTEQERDAKSAALHETELALADKVATLARATTELDERTLTADAQHVEITALRTQVDALGVQLEHHEKDVRDTENRLVRERSDADAATRELSDARGKAESLGNRVDELQRQVIAQASEAETLARRARDLETRTTEQDRLLVEREHALGALQAALDTARKAEAELHREVAATDGRPRTLAESVRADNVRLQTALEQVTGERVRLEQEIAATKRETETISSERTENALLRERIHDIAAEVARITMALEGPDSPIAAILAGDGPATNGAGQGHDAQPSDLADRIRALQNKASRLAPAS
jgi:predicted  nucleic acid-binding Zn-ribbon protein